MRRLALPLLAITLLSACATAITPVEVTRFHTGDQGVRGSIAVDALANSDTDASSMEFRTYAGAVENELRRIGFTTDGQATAYVAAITYRRGFRDPLVERRGNPVSVGVGAGGGSYGGGVGVGIGIDLSGPPKRMIATEIQVRILRRADSSVIWEGRASTFAKEGTPAAQPGIAAAKLTGALFRDFPGRSGETITVK